MGEALTGSFEDLVAHVMGDRKPCRDQERLAEEGLSDVFTVPPRPACSLGNATPADLGPVNARSGRTDDQRDQRSIDALGLPDLSVDSALGGEPVSASGRLSSTSNVVVVETLEMILSRALNHGYGESRSVWRIDRSKVVGGPGTWRIR